jgi:hypothetical protein
LHREQRLSGYRNVISNPISRYGCLTRQRDLSSLPSPICLVSRSLRGCPRPTPIVTPGEEQMLITSIDAAELSPFRFHGWLGKRPTAS